MMCLQSSKLLNTQIQSTANDSEVYILNIDENLVEKDKLADYHSSVKVSQNVSKNGKG